MATLPYIEFMGYRFQVVHYSGDLWRADRFSRLIGSLASEDYEGARIKYFTTAREELASYTFRGMPHTKQWRPSRPLTLINMFHAPTRQAILNFFASRHNDTRVAALQTAFPVNVEGKVYRVSTEETMEQDDVFLAGLCEALTFADGYYIPAQGEGPAGSFHSEVGICQRALRFLTLVFTARNGPPPPPDRGTRRNRNRGNRRNNRRNHSPLPSSVMKRVRFNNINNTNNASPSFPSFPSSPPRQTRRFAPLSFNNSNNIVA